MKDSVSRTKTSEVNLTHRAEMRVTVLGTEDKIEEMETSKRTLNSNNNKRKEQKSQEIWDTMKVQNL